MQPGITHVNHLMLIGSCFTENIGNILQAYKFPVKENPNGILFNPVSVAEALQMYIDNEQITENDVFEYNEVWHSWRHHSRFSGISSAEAIDKINTSTHAAHEYLKHADYLLITLGSAWVYTLKSEALGNRTGKVAANNHKAPAAWFNKQLLTTEEILATLDNILHRLFKFNNELRVIFTISPVRHLREGMIENNRSKAALIQAVHQLVNKFDKLYYFPAYELVIDDLRDYRFYAEDLVHPNYHATKYIWEKFSEACIEEETLISMETIKEILMAYKHNPFNPNSIQHIAFRKKYQEITERFLLSYPRLDFKDALHYFKTGERLTPPTLFLGE